MKIKIHPKFYTEAKVSCACGSTWTTGSTKEELKVEICSECHPFYTGKAKLLDTAGRVDRFKARLEKSKTLSTKRVSGKEKKQKRAAQAAAKEADKPEAPKAEKSK